MIKNTLSLFSKILNDLMTNDLMTNDIVVNRIGSALNML